MATIAEVRVKYRKIHDVLRNPFYQKKHGKGGVTLQEQINFDSAHGKCWADCGAEIKTASDYVAPVLIKTIETRIVELEIEVKALKDKKL